VGYGSALLGLELVAALLAYALERERPDDLILLPAQRIYYRAVLLYVAGRALVSAIRGAWVDWIKVERSTVSPQPLHSN